MDYRKYDDTIMENVISKEKIMKKIFFRHSAQLRADADNDAGIWSDVVCGYR